jgi:L-iditol 2-dehydrogenase
MKAVVFRGGDALRVEEWPRPRASAGELLLRLRGCGLCGSDIAKLVALAPAAPAVFGHELVGDVVEVGEGAGTLASGERPEVGDRVVAAHHVPCGGCHYCRRGSPSMCRAFKASNLDPGGFAELIRVPAANVRHATFRIPPAVSDEAASFVEPLACCARAVRRGRVEGGDTVAVVGLGSVGNLFVQLYTRAGAAVIGVDPIAARRDLARRLGAADADGPDRAGAAIRAHSDGRGADQVLVTGGGAAVLAWAMSVVRDGGTLHVFAGGEGDGLPVPLQALYQREITLTTTYSSSPADLAESFRLITRGEVTVEPLITHRLPLAELAAGVELMRRRQALKVYVTP